MVLTGYSVFVILALESWLAFYLASAHERRTRKHVSTLHHFPALRFQTAPASHVQPPITPSPLVP